VTPAISKAVFIGLDTEWCRDTKRRFRNIVLAYGLVVVCGDRVARIVVEPNGVRKSHRVSLKRLIGLAVQKAIRVDVLDGWPDEVCLAVHYGRGDLAACSDFKALKPRLAAVKGTLASQSRPIDLDVDVDEKSGLPVEYLPLVPRALTCNALDRAGNGHRLRARVLDTFCLAPGGASLEALGKLLGYHKLELPAGYDPADMARFQTEQPDAFQAYLLRDAEITARYAKRYTEFCARELELRQPPGTLGAAAVAVLLSELRAMGLDRLDLFGLKMVKAQSYSRARHRRRTWKQEELTFASKLIAEAAADAYSGGRTETYRTGPVSAGVLRDVDLRSAYPTAMAAIGVPDYVRCRIVREEEEGVEEFRAGVLGFAEVEFDTPATVRFPVFGVRTERGLIFPRRGRTAATAPEIAAARQLGVAVTIKLGVIIPWDTRVRPYERFVVKMLTLRERLKSDGKDTLESKTVKEMTNSVYGKTAQGVRQRTQYDTRTGGSKPLSRSSVTSPALAAYTTGLVRAAIAELLNAIPPGEVVVSVSTDGFLTTAPIEALDLDGPAIRVLLAARRRISQQTGAPPRGDHAELLEVKKEALEVVAFRNRGIATTAAARGQDPVLAKNGIKVPMGCDANRLVLGLYLNRNHDTRVERRDLIALRDQMEQEADLVSVLRNPRVNFEPDMKRRLARASTATIGHGEFAGTEHLATESEPFDTVGQALEERAVFEAWRDAQKRVLKTMADWEAWQEYRASVLARRSAGAGIRVTQGGAADVLKRQFLRALVRGMWGASLDGSTHEAVASWLTACGHPTSVSAVKNATRPYATPIEGVVAAAPASLELLLALVAEFPGLEVERLFTPADAGAARTYLARVTAA
jgi:hypothetical protein